MNQIAQEAYESYGESVGWKNYRGDPMPPWDDLPEAIKTAWRAATKSVIDEIDHRIGGLFDSMKGP